jgi:hypothetical protein
MLRLATLLLLFTLPLSALTLIEQVAKSKEGDYLVTYQNRTYTLLLIRQVNGDSVTFEEISVPRRRGGGPGMPWSQWVARGAPSYTSWLTYTINTQDRKVGDTYSFARGGWVACNQNEAFLTTLLTLQFQPIPPEQRKRTGNGRAIWHPPLCFEGRSTRDIPFNAYTATWPRDGSMLAGKQIIIYLPAQEGAWPAHFPYWIEVSPLPVDQRIRVVDSGRSLHSPKRLPSS